MGAKYLQDGDFFVSIALGEVLSITTLEILDGL